MPIKNRDDNLVTTCCDELAPYVPGLVERALEITDHKTRDRIIQVIQFAPPEDALAGLKQPYKMRNLRASRWASFQQNIVRLQRFLNW